MDEVATIAHSSQDDGAAVANALTTPGAKVADLDREARRDRRAGAPERRAGRAARPARPAARREPAADRGAAAARQRRRRARRHARDDGADEVRRATRRLLSAQADRLLASDVVWTTSSRSPSATRDGERRASSGVAPPDSDFVANRQLFTRALDGARAAAPARRVDGRQRRPGVHGTNIVATKASPAARRCPTTTENTVTATTDLAFAVTVDDSGDSQEVGIKVTLTIQQNPSDRADEDDQGDQPGPAEVRVTFTNLGEVHVRAEGQVVHVDVAPRAGRASDRRTTRRRYPVIFSLG